MIAGTSGSLLGKEKNIKPGQCKISKPLPADFFELFTLPASLKLNTQRRSAPSMRAFKGGGTERPYFCDINKRNYRVQNRLCQLLASRSVCNWRVQPCDSYLKERFLSLIVCLFVFFFSLSAFLVVFILTFFVIRIFFPSVFFNPHFPIRIRHRRYPASVLQTPWKFLNFDGVFEQPGPGIVKKKIVDIVLDVIINFIYWEFHM